ncbi:aminotransferase class I/II-fold pyridoxal phosphate-dependent enzyme [Anaerotignum lactatifermentans]|uniref:Aminotransferase class I/II-fold pyridoxal phosphate-dependent enzyme n=1 Tax=Anaerotignum lactatifermentans TaxID=160404 RepID=A0ABS2GB32_9FIRM|nr:aminotransferase class I/II-fold pyridoxal phosphate-dependent enzyme [Anaerotignum lactatifermentans]MBM6829810.1 aminotransferase class I/II-fold pyridoxal phosphate-dependent enzyme [Anaerotignum lactatifermentans]MBM6878250.1 aminotransferase class I/II-fold pyridoxal phosphate-dependent enzyme [Anaerotignum lactatifermentans]MBM6951330.1 aminotransferase class I/II-fold pyridoxal phosphate-dependent enzyme [Anaerotignum lactatifermentans]
MKQDLVHGGDWAGYEKTYGKPPLDFSANISPLGLPEGVREAVTAALSTADRYPDPLCRELTAAIAQKEGVPEEWCLCGNGAADLIFRAVYGLKPKKALVPVPAFAEYEGALRAAGCAVERHLLLAERDFSLGREFLEKIRPEVDMVFLCQPNNPTGLTVERAFLEEILERCRQAGAVLVLDECFVDFLDRPEEDTMIGELEKAEHLLILKAFTKLYAMAGIRLGYCLCSCEKLLENMRQAGQPWGVSSLAQAAGLAALAEKEYVSRVRALIAAERPWLAKRLAALGLRVLPGKANYLMFQSPCALGEPMEKRGILLRNCGNYPGLDQSWYRTAVRTHAENEVLVKALEEVLR